MINFILYSYFSLSFFSFFFLSVCIFFLLYGYGGVKGDKATTSPRDKSLSCNFSFLEFHSGVTSCRHDLRSKESILVSLGYALCMTTSDGLFVYFTYLNDVYGISHWLRFGAY